MSYRHALQLCTPIAPEVQSTRSTSPRGKSTAYRNNLVPIEVADVGGVEVGIVLGPEARRPIALSALSKCRGVEGIDRSPGGCAEGDHVAVSSGGGVPIDWRADPEGEFAGAILLVEAPADRAAIPGGIARDAALHGQWREDGVVEVFGPLKVIGAEINVAKHRDHPMETRTCEYLNIVLKGAAK